MVIDVYNFGDVQVFNHELHQVVLLSLCFSRLRLLTLACSQKKKKNH